MSVKVRRPGHNEKRVGIQPTTIRPAYTRRAGKKKSRWYDEDASYKPPKGPFRRDEENIE